MNEQRITDMVRLVVIVIAIGAAIVFSIEGWRHIVVVRQHPTLTAVFGVLLCFDVLALLFGLRQSRRLYLAGLLGSVILLPVVAGVIAIVLYLSASLVSPS